MGLAHGLGQFHGSLRGNLLAGPHLIHGHVNCFGSGFGGSLLGGLGHSSLDLLLLGPLLSTLGRRHQPLSPLVPDLHNGVAGTVPAADRGKDGGRENSVPAGPTDYSVPVPNVIRRESRYLRGSCCHLHPGRRPPPPHRGGG